MGDVSQRTPEAANALVVVGVGASAGGLEAIFELLDAIPAEPGFALVVVTHQLAGRASLLPDLLRHHTGMRVVQASERVTLEPNHVYLPPAGSTFSATPESIEPLQPSPDGPRYPIDTFFRSLAEAKGHLAVGVVLSGMGTDGTLGLQAIRAAGGLTLAQSTDSASHSGMPTSARLAGAVDESTTPARMAPRLVQHAERWFSAVETEESLGPTMEQIIGLIRDRRGKDFSHYKQSTLRRRILRRFAIHGVASPPEYLSLLATDPDELDLLIQELLIGVTSFFRDPKAFEALGTLALRPLLAAKPPDEDLRAWVAGCSTGEEAYSVAILLHELVSELGLRNRVQVFATDLDPRAIEKARAGSFPLGVAVDIGAERLSRFFTEEGDRYVVRKSIRDSLVFAVQDLIHDPPFTRLDLLVCRNVLIYFDATLQRRLLPLFQYALRPNGVLFLGSSEAIADNHDRFPVIDREWRLFRRGRDLGARPMPETYQGGALLRRRSPASRAAQPLQALHLAEKALLSVLPPTVLVDANGDIVHVHGRTGRYLEPSPGAPRMNLVLMARDGLQHRLRSALRDSAARPHETVRSRVRFPPQVPNAHVRLRVSRIQQPSALAGLTSVTFDEEPTASVAESDVQTAEQPTAREAELEGELSDARENLQSSVEELETMNEELKSTNEELQSTNEELQSSNEELETSREEMQSLNEELQTVNLELQRKIDELTAANDDMHNLLASTKIATIFLDRELRIQSFTPAATQVVNLIETDIGRPLADLVAKVEDRDLVEDARGVLRDLQPRLIEVQAPGGTWFLARIGPYQTGQGTVSGVVLTFVDVSPLKAAQQRSERAARVAEAIVDLMPDPLIVLDEARQVVCVSASLSADRSSFGAGERGLEELGQLGADLATLLVERPELLQPPGATSREGARASLGPDGASVRVRVAPPGSDPSLIAIAIESRAEATS